MRPSWPSTNHSWSTTIGRRSEGPLNIYGSVQQYGRGPVGTFGTTSHRLPQALHLGSATELCLPTELPGAVDGLVGPDLDHPTPRARPRTPVPTLLPGIGTTTPLTNYCATTRRASRLPRHHRSDTAHQCHRNRQRRGYRHAWAVPATLPRHHVLHGQRQPCLVSCTGFTAGGAGATTTTIQGLTPGTSYVFTVTATNADGTSDPSQPSARSPLPPVRSPPAWSPPSVTPTTRSP